MHIWIIHLLKQPYSIDIFVCLNKIYSTRAFTVHDHLFNSEGDSATGRKSELLMWTSNRETEARFNVVIRNIKILKALLKSVICIYPHEIVHLTQSVYYSSTNTLFTLCVLAFTDVVHLPASHSCGFFCCPLSGVLCFFPSRSTVCACQMLSILQLKEKWKCIVLKMQGGMAILF